MRENHHRRSQRYHHPLLTGSILILPLKQHMLTLISPSRFPGVLLFSEIYQVTGPVARFARQIAGQGYIVAAPSSYHDFTGPEPLAYDVPGTDQGNEWKVKKVSLFFVIECHAEVKTFMLTSLRFQSQTLESYDADSYKTVDYLLSLPTCTGLIGATGMCLGGHLALRAAVSCLLSRDRTSPSPTGSELGAIETRASPVKLTFLGLDQL